MEAYSPTMQAALQQQLRASTPADLETLRPYFEKRRGPGLALLLAELDARQSAAPTDYSPHGRRITA